MAHNVEIVIFVLPHELPGLEKLIHRLRVGSMFLADTEPDLSWLSLRVIMGISDEVVDWESSTVSKQKVLQDFEEIRSEVDWIPRTFLATSEINGCTSARRYASLVSEADAFIWLDTDIVASPRTLGGLVHSYTSLLELGYETFVITPQTVRLWDITWDCLVHPKFLNEPLGYQRTNDIYLDVQRCNSDPVELVGPISAGVAGQPRMKFAGGWFTLITSALLKKVPIPNSFSHYGLEDTYIMWGCEVLRNPQFQQFLLQNCIVGEQYKNRQDLIDSRIVLIDRRAEYKAINEQQFSLELDKLRNTQ